jgi:hypothetical protein
MEPASRPTNSSNSSNGLLEQAKDDNGLRAVFLSATFPNIFNRAGDQLEPLPETPLFQERQRQQAVKKQPCRDDDPVFSSKYLPVWKETAKMFPPGFLGTGFDGKEGVMRLDRSAKALIAKINYA